MERLTVWVIGRVQGVGFRHFTRRQATRLDLTGWVRNEPDGSVKVVAEGPRKDLEYLLKALQDGPRISNVKEVRPHWSTASKVFPDFVVRYF